jgi:hypothetical protein
VEDDSCLLSLGARRSLTIYLDEPVDANTVEVVVSHATRVGPT